MCEPGSYPGFAVCGQTTTGDDVSMTTCGIRPDVGTINIHEIYSKIQVNLPHRDVVVDQMDFYYQLDLYIS